MRPEEFSRDKASRYVKVEPGPHEKFYGYACDAQGNIRDRHAFVMHNSEAEVLAAAHYFGYETYPGETK
jgi:hypothetical protein